ncbi:MAG: hypothetical protein Q8936_03670 [Bacillota bacterium]|nr:hypothetical protein [Bacillota bacterium]
MQINQASQLAQLNGITGSTAIDSTALNGTTSSMFSSILEQMMQNGNSASTTASGSGTNISSDSNSSMVKTGTTSGLDSLSIQPQKMLQMFQLQAMQNNSSSSNNLIGSDDSSDSSDDESDGTSIPGIDGSMMSQLMSSLLEASTQNQNQTQNATESNLFNLL